MKRMWVWLVAGCLAGIAWEGCRHLPALPGGGARTVGLKTDLLIDPVGIDQPPRFSWQMASKRRGAAQQAYQIRVFAPDLGKEPVWDSGIVPGDSSLGIRYAGAELRPATRYVWEVRVQDERGEWLAPERAAFRTGLISPEGWDGSVWISPATPKGAIDTAAFRKSFQNEREIVSAIWFVTGLGVFEAYVNGTPVYGIERGKPVRDVLKPGFTTVSKCRHAFSYDITPLLKRKAGERNVLSALVAQGWWRDEIVGKGAGKESAFRGMLVIRYADGSEERLGTGTNWMAAYAGPLVEATIFNGEVYDARIGTGWMKGGPLGPEWAPAKINTEFTGEIRSLKGPPIRVREDLILIPKEMVVYNGAEGATKDQFGVIRRLRTYAGGEKPVKLEKGETLVVDLGQNAAGLTAFTVSGRAGTQLTVRHAEMLHAGNGLKSRGNDGPEGSPYLANLRGIFAGIKYTLAGLSQEAYQTRFSFFGCRYLRMTATDTVTLSKIRFLPVTSLPEGYDTGTFTTSDPLVNRLVANIRWGQYSNYLSVPTDCPQRNERQGWTADTQVFTKAAAYNANVYAFLCKWMDDMRDSQFENGAFPSVAPLGKYGTSGAVTGWADAGVIVPYTLYRMFGDTTILEENYAALCRYLDHVTAHKGPDRQNYGDWLAYERNDNDIKMYLAACYWVWDARMMGEIAGVLGKKEDMERFRQIEKEARAFFSETYLNEDGTIREKYRCQTAAIFAIYLDLTFPAAMEKVKRDLLENIARHGDKLQTGFLGTSIIMEALDKAGATDVAYTLLLQRGNPSWLYSVDQGATTVWERWNSYVKETGFGPVGMNSFNHYAYGAVAAWMYGTMAGIRETFDQPGFKRILIRPIPDPRVKRVDATFNSSYGQIAVSSTYETRNTAEGPSWRYRVTLPANTRADVVLPPGRDLTVNGKLREQLVLARDGIEFVETMANGSLRFLAVSGSYTVQMTAP
ncbi:MAG: family 78 glycoside hydrolase catalytic domain [Kiritimatiellae bacterium]|nr:family 78 glycoside hydrolase catalytic domain [Kiritimatiellia bacterium]